jgi:hypothetical protein
MCLLIIHITGFIARGICFQHGSIYSSASRRLTALFRVINPKDLFSSEGLVFNGLNLLPRSKALCNKDPHLSSRLNTSASESLQPCITGARYVRYLLNTRTHDLRFSIAM